MERLWQCLFVCAVAALVGCATAIEGTTEELVIESVPPGATVTIEPGGHTLMTPGSIELKRGSEYEIRFELEGYAPKIVRVWPQAHGATAGNIIAGGLVGATVDQISGAAYRLFPNPVVGHLTAIDGAPSADVQSGRVVFFNTSNSVLYFDSGVISVEVDGVLIGTIDIGEALEAQIEVGPHRLVVAHRDFWLFDDEYEVVVGPGEQYFKVWARPTSTRLEVVDELPAEFRVSLEDQSEQGGTVAR